MTDYGRELCPNMAGNSVFTGRLKRLSATFNTSCINGLEDAVFIQILINIEQHRMAIRMCNEDDKDAIRWCIAKPDKRKSRKITSKAFSERIYSMMGWNSDCRYKILGHRINYNGEVLYVFELDEMEITKERKRKTKKQMMEEAENSSYTPEQIAAREAEEAKMDRRPFYPDDWSHSFGVPVKEHRNIVLETIDGYGFIDAPNRQEDKE